jgi:hypothetical protein
MLCFQIHHGIVQALTVGCLRVLASCHLGCKDDAVQNSNVSAIDVQYSHQFSRCAIQHFNYSTVQPMIHHCRYQKAFYDTYSLTLAVQARSPSSALQLHNRECHICALAARSMEEIRKVQYSTSACRFKFLDMFRFYTAHMS